MTGTLGYDDIRAATVRQVAQLMAAAAITAPKSGGQLFLAGKPNVRREAGNSIPLTPLKGRPGTEIVVLNYK